METIFFSELETSLNGKKPLARNIATTKKTSVPPETPTQSKQNSYKTQKHDMQSSLSSDPTCPKGRSIVVVLYSQIPLHYSGLGGKKKKVHKKQEACI